MRHPCWAANAATAASAQSNAERRAHCGRRVRSIAQPARGLPPNPRACCVHAGGGASDARWLASHIRRARGGSIGDRAVREKMGRQRCGDSSHATTRALRPHLLAGSMQQPSAAVCKAHRRGEELVEVRPCASTERHAIHAWVARQNSMLACPETDQPRSLSTEPAAKLNANEHEMAPCGVADLTASVPSFPSGSCSDNLAWLDNIRNSAAIQIHQPHMARNPRTNPLSTVDGMSPSGSNRGGGILVSGRGHWGWQHPAASTRSWWHVQQVAPPALCLFVCCYSYMLVSLLACLLVCLFVCLLACFCLFVCLFVFLFVCLFVCFCLFVCLFLFVFVCLFVCLFVSLFVRLFVCWFVCMSVCLLICVFVCFVSSFLRLWFGVCSVLGFVCCGLVFVQS